jgi:hypothetical protein
MRVLLILDDVELHSKTSGESPVHRTCHKKQAIVATHRTKQVKIGQMLITLSRKTTVWSLCVVIVVVVVIYDLRGKDLPMRRNSKRL